jgi:multicomponent Na+:H+ antiporter subunit D
MLAATSLPLFAAENLLRLPPAWIFILAALALAALAPTHRGARAAVLLATPLLGVANLATLAPGNAWTLTVMELELVLLRVDRLSLLFGLLFHLAALIGAIYALRAKDRLEHSAAFAYAGGALGAVFAGDLLTLFVYWEVMAVASAFVIFARRTSEASQAGLRYLAMQLLSGLLLLAGALLHYRTSGTVAFEALDARTPAGALILVAFGIKCGFPLLHGWIVDAYPRATASGTVFLSMFTTKVAVYALARGFAGTEILVPIGTAMAVLPIFYAVIENDLRRVLCYSMINQIGFMVAGIGIGTELALNGAVAHAFNEVLFKGLLFMTMGAVLFRVGHALGSDLGGLYRSMPVTTALCVVGAASISAFPLFSGFVSKSMIMAAMVETGHTVAWLALLFASAGVFHHAGIKIPYFAFFSHDSGLRVREAPREMLVAMTIAAAGCVLVGVYPAALYALLPWQVDYVPYTYPHVVAQLQLLVFSALAFAWLKLSGIYPAELRSVNLDVEWLYRRAAPRAWLGMTPAFEHARRALLSAGARASAPLLRMAGPASPLTQQRGSGIAALLTGLLLAVYLLLHYIGVERA